MKILIVEDEGQLARMMAQMLSENGFVVETAPDFATAEEKIGLYEYDIVLLDLMLPDGNGLDLLPLITDKSNPAQIIITSAKASVEDRVTGLDLGADDYLPKPFDLSELLARVKSHSRRRQGGRKSLTAGNVELFPEERAATVSGKALNLLHKEFHILQYFLNRPERVIDKQALAEAVWGDHADQSDNFNYVYQQVANLKKKLKEAGADIAIQSVYGFGYKLSQPPLPSGSGKGETEPEEENPRPGKKEMP